MKPSICIVILAALYICDAADRGRPVISNARLLTDKGTVLRGIRYAFDFGEALPSRAQVLSLSTTYGLNAVHLYPENYSTPVGQNVAKIDSLVAWTSQAGLYLVLTIGCGVNNGHYNRTQATGFWNYYGPRYKDRTHVIYELHNEPQFVCNETYSDSTIQFEKDMYDLIRSKAPNTMILMMTFAFVPHASFGLADIRKLTNVNWSNAAIAYHGYYWCCRAAEEIDSISPIIRAGYAVINTEFAETGNWTNDAKRYEQMGIGWLNFQYVGGTGGWDMAPFKTNVNGSGLTWIPDYGTWPQAATYIVSDQKISISHSFTVKTIKHDINMSHNGIVIEAGEGTIFNLHGKKIIDGICR